MTRMITDNIFMWETRLSIVDWDCSKTQTLLVTLEIPNQLRCESYVLSEVEHLFTVSWMCKKQTSVSHSSTESEVISLDAGLRMDGTLPLDLWHVVIEVLHSSKDTHQAVRDHYRKEKVDDQVPRSRARIEIQSTLNQKRNSNREVNQLSNGCCTFLKTTKQSSK